MQMRPMMPKGTADFKDRRELSARSALPAGRRREKKSFIGDILPIFTDARSKLYIMGSSSMVTDECTYTCIRTRSHVIMASG
jgi:hypothetical protein